MDQKHQRKARYNKSDRKKKGNNLQLISRGHLPDQSIIGTNTNNN